jgi:hypothetical protein
MRTRNLLLSLLFAAGTALTPALSQARSDIHFGLAIGQSAPPVTAVPAAHNRYGGHEGRYVAPRRGLVWVPGHWEGRGRHRYFVEGRWVREHRYYTTDRFDGRFY